MRLLLPLLLIFIALNSQNLSSQSNETALNKVILFNFQAKNVDTTMVDIFNHLLKEALITNYNYDVTRMSPASMALTSFAAACSAKAYNAKYAVTGSFIEIKEKGIISFQLVDADSQKVVFGDRTTILSYDDMPIIAERIAESFAKRTLFNRTVTPTKITEAEKPSPLRLKKPTATFLLNTGYLYAYRENESVDLFNLNLGLYFDLPNYFILTQMGLMRGVNEESDLNFDINVYKYLSEKDFSPIAGAGIGITRYSFKEYGPWRETKYDDGLYLNAGVGFIGLRNYYIKLYGMLQGNLSLTKTWGTVPGVRVLFGLTSPSLGPGGDVEVEPGCVGLTVGGFFLLGLLAALSS
jgi:TolB-like protein